MLWQARKGLICGRGALDPAAAPGSGPLDGLSPTAAYSFSRFLLGSYGGSLYSTTSGAIDTLLDQSGNSRNLTQATAGFRPLPSTAGPNSVACGDFDGSDDQLTGSTALSNLISNSAGYLIVSVLVDAVANNNANVYQNNCVVGDSGVWMGLFAKNVSGTTPTFFAYNWDTAARSPAGTTFSLATAYVLTWRHEGGTLYLSVNGGTETTVVAGNTNTMTGNLRLGASGAGTFLNGKVFELATFSTIPSSGDRGTLITDFANHVGA